MKLVIFDIDGTLADTVDVDSVCFEKAILEGLELNEIEVEWASYQYSTDSGILYEVVQQHFSRDPAPHEIQRVQDRFLELLEEAWHENPTSFAAMPGAPDLIPALKADPDIALGITTGGWERSARFKLGKAGIDPDGIFASFSDEAYARKALLNSTIEKAGGTAIYDSIIYIGDKPWDLRASKEIGIDFIGFDKNRTHKMVELGAKVVISDYFSFRDLI